MANQYVLGRVDEGEQIRIGHPHCPLCGACLVAGFTKDRHFCHARPVDKAIVRVMAEEMESTEQKSRRHNRLEFDREMRDADVVR